MALICLTETGKVHFAEEGTAGETPDQESIDAFETNLRKWQRKAVNLSAGEVISEIVCFPVSPIASSSLSKP